MIATFARFDLGNLMRQPARSLAQLGVIVVIGAWQPVPGLALLTAIITVSLTAATPFLADERGRLDILYGLLPVQRRDVVVGRYLTMLGYAVLSLAVGTLTTVGVGVVRGQDLDWGLLGLIYLLAVVVIAVSLGIQLPTFFRLGFTRGRPMMFAPVLVLSVALGVLTQLDLVNTATLIRLTALHPVAAAGGAALLAVVVLTASAALSNRWYRARNL